MTETKGSRSQPWFSVSFASKTTPIHAEMLEQAEIRVSGAATWATTGE